MHLACKEFYHSVVPVQIIVTKFFARRIWSTTFNGQNQLRKNKKFYVLVVQFVLMICKLGLQLQSPQLKPSDSNRNSINLQFSWHAFKYLYFNSLIPKINLSSQIETFELIGLGGPGTFNWSCLRGVPTPYLDSKKDDKIISWNRINDTSYIIRRIFNPPPSH